MIVLWWLVLLALLGAKIAGSGRSELLIARNTVAAAQANMLMDAAIAAIAYRALSPDPRDWPPLDGSPIEFGLPGGRATARLLDEGGLVNPNYAPPPLLAALFEGQGLDAEAALALAAAIGDWIDPDEEPADGGAERDAYRQAGALVVPPNAPLQTLEELRLVRGMTGALLASVAPLLTLFGEQAEPNPALAPPPVRAALARLDTGVARAPGQLASLQPPPELVPPSLVRVRLQVETEHGAVRAGQVVLRFEPGSREPYRVLDWQRDD